MLACAGCLLGGSVSGQDCPPATLKNDSLVDGSTVRVCTCFWPGEQAGAVLDAAPGDYPIELLEIHIFWSNAFYPTVVNEPSLEEAIHVYGPGNFPTPGPEIGLFEGPLLTDGGFNVFDVAAFGIIVDDGPFTVSLEFANFNSPPQAPSTSSSVVSDNNGCQAGKNVVYSVTPPAGWNNFCALGGQGDWAIRVVYRSVSCEIEGACCLANEQCAVTTEADCVGNLGGAWQGGGSGCVPNPCLDPEGACCFEPDICVEFTQEFCDLAGGQYEGDYTLCSSTNCFATGACCFGDGACSDGMDQGDCEVGGGTYQGDFSSCSPGLCPEPPGACCFANGNCVVIDRADCEAVPGATYKGPGTTCTPGICTACGAITVVQAASLSDHGALGELPIDIDLAASVGAGGSADVTTETRQAGLTKLFIEVSGADPDGCMSVADIVGNPGGVQVPAYVATFTPDSMTIEFDAPLPNRQVYTVTLDGVAGDADFEVRALAGNVYHDLASQTVNALDIGLTGIRAKFGLPVADPTNTPADVNGDGAINALDTGTVRLLYFGATAP